MFRFTLRAIAALGFLYSVRSLLPPALITQTQSADPSSVTLQQVQKLGELTTIRLPVQVVVPAIATREILGFPQQTKVLVVEQVYVTAGVDLQQAKVSDRVISLPAVEIIDAKVDVTKSSVFDSSQDPLAPDVMPELHIQAQQEALQTGVVAACNSGILGQATAQVRLVVGAIAPTAELAIAPTKGCSYGKTKI